MKNSNRYPTALIIFLVLTTQPLGAQTEGPIRAIPLEPGAVMLHTPESYRGILVGNSVLVQTDSGSILVDTGIPDRATELRAMIDAQGFADIRFIANTHPHLDHTGGNDSIRDYVSPLIGNGPTPAYLARVRQTSPLHSDSDQVFFFPEHNILVTGDIFPGDGYPFLNVDGGATIDTLLAVLDWAIRQADNQTKVVPGHGKLATIADLVAFREMVVTMSARIRDAGARNLTEEEVIAGDMGRGFDERWGSGFLSPAAWARQLYRMLGK